jgi:hypothetical protein
MTDDTASADRALPPASRRGFLAASSAALAGLAGAGLAGPLPARPEEARPPRSAARMEIAEILPPPAGHLWRLRDVKGTPESFVETFHDNGMTDMAACMRAYRDVGFDGVCRPDHVPTMDGDSNDRPGYSTIGRLFALGYIRGLQQTVYSE